MSSKQIPLTQGRFSIVDEEDYEWLMQWKWLVKGAKKSHHTEYAHRTVVRNDGKKGSVKMHRVIMKTRTGYDVDHIDGNGLNNQKN